MAAQIHNDILRAQPHTGNGEFCTTAKKAPPPPKIIGLSAPNDRKKLLAVS
jgi:hypothetical protein